MTAWVMQSGSLAVALLVFFGPGLLIAAAGRLRGLALWAFAPVASTAVAGLLAIAYGLVGIRWNALTFSAGVAVLTALAWLLARWAFPPSSRRPADRTLLLIVALVVGGALIALRLGFYVGSPDAISQTNDAVFHLNALRYIAESGSASSLSLTGVLGAASFYPGGWHALVSVITSLNGGDIPVAVNAASMVIAAVVWPAGIAWFTRSVTRSAATGAIAAALSGVMIHFPLLMFEWGVLYPNALALALLPASLAVVWPGLVRRESTDVRWKQIFRLATFGAIVLIALGLAQPVVVLTWAVLIVVGAVVAIAASPGMSRPRKSVFAAGSIVVVILLWFGMASVSGGAHWGPYGNWAEALGEFVLSAQVDLPLSPLVTLLSLVGAVIAWRQGWGTRPLVLSWAGVSFLMFVATSVANPLVRRWLLGPWYADPYRVAATLPVVMIPLMSIAVLWVVRRLLALLPARRSPRVRPADAGVTIALVGGAVALILWPVLMMPLAPDHEVDEESRYASDDSSFLSPDERKLLMRLDDLVEPGARIIGNPSTGTGFGYALSGVDVIPKNWTHPRDDAWKLLGTHLRDVSKMPAVCDALARYGSPGYVLDFGPGEQTAGRFVLRGMTDFAPAEGFELVAAEGDAELWRITACTETG